ncbi:MAG: FG-GAP repeat protein, partial [Acidobacteriota bacterium]
PGESQTTDGVDGDQCLPPSSSYCARANDFPILTAPGVGAAYVFVRTGTTWKQQNYLKASNSEEEDSFGYVVAIDGDTILIGAHGEDSAAGLNGDQNDNSAAGAGAAYVFLRNGSSWIQQAYLKSDLMAANDEFGYAVALHNDTAVIGAVLQGDGAAFSGAAYVFYRTGSTWSQQGRLKAPTPVTSDYFGGALGVFGDRIVIGAQGEDTGGAESGAAYIFKRTGGVWSQEALLKASDTDPDDNFGFAVAIQDTVVIVTASNENGTAEGTAYVFVLQSSKWVESAILRGRKTEAFDRFGSAVAFSEETAIIGARYEESNATGIDGDEENNLLGQTGAAYTFLVEPIRVTTNVVANARQTSPGGVATIYITLTNPGSTARDSNLTFTIPDQLIVVPGSCNGATGVCTIGQSAKMADGGQLRRAIFGKSATVSPNSIPWVINWTGLISGYSSLTISFQVQIGNQVTSGTQVCIPLAVGGSTQNVCFTVAAPPPGPGATIPVAAAASPQKAGSILIYNIYTSGLNPAIHDTRLTITNTSPFNSINVHLFFVDGSSCTVADQFVTLTQNQTLSMLASDIDPGVTGYVIGIATDDRGCPINQNDLIGGALVNFEQGHRANLAAIGITALSGQLASCNDSSSTATLSFDGVSYNTLPRTLALDSLPSRANMNETMLVINRLGGDLGTGATRLTTLAGLLFDDQESSQSFTLGGGNCQMVGMLGNNLPRTSPRYDAVIPAGRTGWMKLSQVSDGAISGAMINLSTIGFSQGHNLHVLTTTATASLTIPVYPAR